MAEEQGRTLNSSNKCNATSRERCRGKDCSGTSIGAR